MSGFVEVRIEYGFSAQDKYTHKMHFLGSGGANWVGPDMAGSLIPTGLPPTYAPMNAVGLYVFNYLKCLEQVVQPGVQFLGAAGEQFVYTDWGTRTLMYTAHYDLTDFTPRAGNTAAAGPRGRDFLAARQPIAATHGKGWLRFHYVEGRILSKHTVLSPADISADFALWYPNLRSLGVPIDSYAVLSSVLSLDPQPTSKALPGLLLQQGLRNG